MEISYRTFFAIFSVRFFMLFSSGAGLNPFQVVRKMSLVPKLSGNPKLP